MRIGVMVIKIIVHCFHHCPWHLGSTGSIEIGYRTIKVSARKRTSLDRQVTLLDPTRWNPRAATGRVRAMNDYLITITPNALGLSDKRETGVIIDYCRSGWPTSPTLRRHRNRVGAEH